MSGLASAHSSPPALGDALDFLRLVWAVDHGLQRASKRMEKETGVTSPQHLVIRIVGKFPGISAGMLAQVLHVHPGTLTGMVKRLERQGLMQRRADPRDGRRTLLGLTEKGRSYDATHDGLVELAVRATLNGAALENLRAAREVLESLASTLLGSQPPAPVDAGRRQVSRKKRGRKR